MVTAAGTLGNPVALAEALNALAVLDLQTGQGAEAEVLLREALDLAGRAEGEGRVGMLVNLASALQNEERFDEADSLYVAGVDLLREGLGSEHPLHFNAMAALASVRGRRGEADEARALYAVAIPGLRRVEGATPKLAVVLTQFGALLRDDGDVSGAEVAYREGVSIERAARGPGHPAVGISTALLAGFLCGTRRFEEERMRYEEALQVLEVAFPPEHPRVNDARAGLERCGVGTDAG